MRNKVFRSLAAVTLSLSLVAMTACGSGSTSGGASGDSADVTASADASGDASGDAGSGGGSGSAGQEFATYEEVSSFAGITVSGDEVTYSEGYAGDISGDSSSVTADGIKGVTITAEEANGIAISKDSEDDVFTIEDSTISVSAGQINNDAGYEAVAGVGVGMEAGELWIKNSSISSEDARSTPVYMLSTDSPEATSLVVQDSVLTAHSDEIWMPPFKLLAGGARATLLMTRNNSWFYGSTVTSNNWGAISQDSVDAYTYVVNSTGTSTDGGYATYLTYGMRLYGSSLYGGQYGVFMCGESDIITDTGAAALEDDDAMSKVPDYDVDTEAVSTIAAPFNAIVVHNSLADTSMVAKGVFKNTVISTMTEDLSDDVTPMSYDDEFFMPGVDIIGSGAGCGASYFFSKNLYGSIALVRSMNADFTFDASDVRSSNGVLLQSVVTYDPPSASGYLAIGEGEDVPGISGTYENGTYEGDILHQDYQRKMTVTVGENATLKGAVVSGTYQGWIDLWSEENLVAMLEDDGYSEDVFNNDSWVEDVQANLIVADDTDYADTENYGVDMTVVSGSEWVVTGRSALGSLTIEDGASVTAPEGMTIKIYENCDASNSLSTYDESAGEEVSELAPGTYENVVIVVE